MNVEVCELPQQEAVNLTPFLVFELPLTYTVHTHTHAVASSCTSACLPGDLPSFPGDLSVESSVYEWLIDDDNRELMGTLEEVNRHMLNRLIEFNPFVAAVFISKNGSGESSPVLCNLFVAAVYCI